MKILKGIIYSPTEPPSTEVMWIRPVEGGVAFYLFDGFWKILRPVNDKGSINPEDDQPYDLDGVGAKKLSDLEDVAMASVTEGQILKYNGSSWENADDEATPGPDSVGTEQIIDGAVEMQDLHDDVKGKIQKTYDISDESLSMDFDIQP